MASSSSIWPSRPSPSSSLLSYSSRSTVLVLTDKLPKLAQHQDEFYRSGFSFTFGNVCLSPEFESARRTRVAGRIDFLNPVVKWGVELTRDGNRLYEHSSRFTDSGAYGAW
ncbi:hypothetical protein JOM56_000168 [Amanita muscaria]